MTFWKISAFVAVALAGVLEDCEDDANVPPIGPTDAGSFVDSATPTDAARGEDGSSRDPSDASAACTRGAVEERDLRLFVTGKIITQDGKPRSGHAIFRDRTGRQSSGEASVNDAGFFLLPMRTIFDPARCGDWWIEIDGGDGPAVFGELDANEIVREAWSSSSSDRQDVDISGAPIQVRP